MIHIGANWSSKCKIEAGGDQVRWAVGFWQTASRGATGSERSVKRTLVAKMSAMRVVDVCSPVKMKSTD